MAVKGYAHCWVHTEVRTKGNFRCIGLVFRSYQPEMTEAINKRGDRLSLLLSFRQLVVIIPAAQYRRPLVDTKLYCSVIEARV